LPPDEAAVVQLPAVLPCDQTSVRLEGVTVVRFHVIETPRYDQIFILGVQAAGVITAASGVRLLAPT
jgi:hypothetical protein